MQDDILQALNTPIVSNLKKLHVSASWILLCTFRLLDHWCTEYILHQIYAMYWVHTYIFSMYLSHMLIWTICTPTNIFVAIIALYLPLPLPNPSMGPDRVPLSKRSLLLHCSMNNPTTPKRGNPIKWNDDLKMRHPGFLVTQHSPRLWENHAMKCKLSITCPIVQ